MYQSSSGNDIMKSAPVGSSPPANQGDFDLFRCVSICDILRVRGVS